MPSSARTPFPVVPFEITCTELRVYDKNSISDVCTALGPGLTFMDFSASFGDDGYALENAPYQLSFYVLDFSTTRCTFALTGAKKLSFDYPYTTIADLQKNPVRAAHYNIQGKVMGTSYGHYVVDDGTGRILVEDGHYGSNYGQPYEAVGTVLSINGAFSETFNEHHGELLVYDLSTTITHQPTASLNTVVSGFPTSDYTRATDGTTLYWVSERFRDTLQYLSGGLADDPTLRCKYNGNFCVIVNYKSLNTTAYGSTLAFTGYLIYGDEDCACLLFNNSVEA